MSTHPININKMTLNLTNSIEKNDLQSNYWNENPLFKERFNDGEENVYMKSPGASCIVLVKHKEYKNIIGSWFEKIFLPQGYPQSVSDDYINYQIWDTAQAFCSTFTGVAATQEVLKSLGVGDITATFYGATVTWILKTVSGQMGGIAFAYSYGSYLDAYSKKWRLIADIFNDLALCLELALPLYINLTPLVLCVTSAMKAVVGIAGGATKSAMIHHHAIRGNAADVSAKDSVQETAVNMISSVIAIFLLPFLSFPALVFLSMIIFHIFSNYMAVRSLCLKTFNDTRYLQVIDMFLKKQLILDPSVVNMEEPLNLWEFVTPMLDKKICGFQIQIGKSLSTVHNKIKDVKRWMSIKNIYKNNNYILYPDTEEKIVYLYIKDDITSEELLRGYFHAVELASVISTINNQILPIFQNNTNMSFLKICESMKNVEWKNSDDLNVITYVYHMVEKDWEVLCTELKKKGWNLNKHLLIADEWRITSN